MRHKYIYGPVPSRRLGLSLGIDIVPYKNCSFNCIYCQLGPTTNRTVKRGEYQPADKVLSDVEDFLKKGGRADYLTLSGSGEPTLHSRIGYIIDVLKQYSKIPIAVLTNGSLFHLEEVRKAIAGADIVLPTLSTADRETFKKIHRPAPELDIDQIIEGQIEFRQEFKGQIWLEVMLIKGLNDTSREIEGLREVIKNIDPDRIHLNTVVRPPAENYARPLDIEELNKIKEFFGARCEVIAPFKREGERQYFKEKKGVILELIKRRPVTLDDIVSALGMVRNEVLKYLDQLIIEKKIKVVEHNGRRYYEFIADN
ncbi:hypothetical protein BXT86_00840 [candidate division WOR-3 bacterium 4484_100]|uniref:Radical SAM core domain-containing protein n=1 Tax=candidate division WOR-3 bacterium 4484_100 TaxID=1936077 RepID=A0A1V4QGX4_UNCW3|nr:MAG: hypothetical protein BXT86_00840 [candidate division WOR-3 bacterium 4484_100]